jgi:hypothetical protein
MQSHRILLAMGALSSLLGACGQTRGSSTSTTVARHPMVTVMPDSGLRDGQTVRVTVSGFPPGKAFLSECASLSGANPIGCGAQLAAQPFVVIENGGGTVSFTVTVRAAMAQLSSATATCTTGCVVVATAGESSSGAGGVATAPISFAP